MAFPDLVKTQSAVSLANHVMIEEPVKAFRFHDFYVNRQAEQEWRGVYPFAKFSIKERASFSYRSDYAFTLTWTPGHISLVGDLGELTLVHYSALCRFEDVGWALSPDHEYLMSKTNVQQVYSPEKTLRDIVRILNEEPIRALNGDTTWSYLREDDGTFRKCVRTRSGGFRHELQEWRRADPKDRDEALELGDDGCWDAWLSVWRELRSYFTTENGLTFVRLAKNRRELKREMEDEFETADRAARFLSKCGFDDYYGSYVWPERTYWQIAAIQHGVRMILAAQAPEKIDLREEAA